MRYTYKIRLNYVFSTLDIIPSEFWYTLVCVTFGIPVCTQTGSGIIAMILSSETRLQCSRFIRLERRNRK